jgi:chromosome segregation ATPase
LRRGNIALHNQIASLTSQLNDVTTDRDRCLKTAGMWQKWHLKARKEHKKLQEEHKTLQDKHIALEYHQAMHKSTIADLEAQLTQSKQRIAALEKKYLAHNVRISDKLRTLESQAKHYLDLVLDRVAFIDTHVKFVRERMEEVDNVVEEVDKATSEPKNP